MEPAFLPADAYGVLRDGLPEARFLNATGMLERMRAIKTPQEIAKLRTASELITNSMLSVFASQGEGSSKGEIVEALRRAETNRGLQFEYALLTLGSSHNRAVSPQRWEAGEILSLDSGGNYQGYIGDLCRMAVLGEPDSELGDLLAEIEAVQQAAISNAYAGTLGGDLIAHAEGVLKSSPSAEFTDFFAHGMGLITHEMPFLMTNHPVAYEGVDAARPLQAGMVISVETTMLHPSRGFIKLEDTVAIHESGPELMGDRGRGWNLAAHSEIEGKMSLKGKTLFISGGSRGIGLAIAIRAARDGANVTIAAKTAEPHPKLPGTIYTAAEEIEQAGGKALPVICDIREEKQVADAVRKTVEMFGGIDICINNASAIQLTGTLETDMKRYDLMHQINTRGTFLVSKMCIPHLKLAEKSSYSESGAAARHERQMVQEPRRLHNGEVRHVHVHAGHERGVPQGRHRRQFPVAADGNRHGRCAQPSRRRRSCESEPVARDHGRCGARYPDAAVARDDRQFLHRRTGAQGSRRNRLLTLCAGGRGPARRRLLRTGRGVCQDGYEGRWTGRIASVDWSGAADILHLRFGRLLTCRGG